VNRPMNFESSIGKRLLIPSVIGLSVALVFLGWTFYSRKEANTALDQAIQAKQVDAARRFRQAYGSDDVRINGFVANPSQIRRGQETLFCYGVMNAKTVRLELPIERVHPALSYCFNAAPVKTTTFTLTAEDAKGKSIQQSVTVVVR
jgi:hypothetical protein